MGWRAWALAFCLLPMAAPGDVLTFNIWPSFNPANNLSCLIELANGQITMVEVRGTGMPPRHPMRWPVRPEEEEALLDALQALISGDLAAAEVYAARSPDPPYLSLTWSSKVNGARVSGLYQQPGLALPPVLARVMEAVIPASGCHARTRPKALIP